MSKIGPVVFLLILVSLPTTATAAQIECTAVDNRAVISYPEKSISSLVITAIDKECRFKINGASVKYESEKTAKLFLNSLKKPSFGKSQQAVKSLASGSPYSNDYDRAEEGERAGISALLDSDGTGIAPGEFVSVVLGCFREFRQLIYKKSVGANGWRSEFSMKTRGDISGIMGKSSNGCTVTSEASKNVTGDGLDAVGGYAGLRSYTSKDHVTRDAIKATISEPHLYAWNYDGQSMTILVIFGSIRESKSFDVD